MATNDKNIIIYPYAGYLGSAGDPTMQFIGASSTLGPQIINLKVYPQNNGTLSYEGSSGQLFSITNDLSSVLFTVNDTSGIPLIEVDVGGIVKLVPFYGSLVINQGTIINNASNPTGIDLIVGYAGSGGGTVGFSGSNSGMVSVQAQSNAGTWTMQLPTIAGSAGQVLSTDGTGITSWVSGGGSYWGSKGFTGSYGAQGPQGYTGSFGFTGSYGAQGPQGYTGSFGYTGSAGSATAGFFGSVGYTGSAVRDYTGSFGFTGSASAVIGYTGSWGYTGSAGSSGGFTGSYGYTGSAGSSGGFTGSYGFTGSAGSGSGSTTITPVTNSPAILWPLMVQYAGSSGSTYTNTTSFGYNGSNPSLMIAGGLYVGSAVHYGNGPGLMTSAVYQFYNAATNSLDTVFG